MTITVGEKINRLTVLESLGSLTVYRDKKRTCVKCACECGKIIIAPFSYIKSGTIKSCGCYRIEIGTRNFIRHGLSIKFKSEYLSWLKMKSRVSLKPSDPNYKYYREIKICDRWLNSFPDFLSDMGEKPTKTHTLDRFPNNGGNYEPLNCRWATKKEQIQNRKHKIKI